MKKHKYIFLLILVLNSFLFTGAGLFAKTTVALDTETYKTYANINVDTLLSIKSENSKGSNAELKEKYDNTYCAILGTVKEIKSKKVMISSDNYPELAITCAAEKKDTISTFSKGDKVVVYGKLTLDLSKNLEMKIDSINKVNYDSLDEHAYSTKNGNLVISHDEMYDRELGKGKVKFHIPESWLSVEHNLIDEKLGDLEGYQYRLNEVNNKNELAQSFFVCYFDIDKYVIDKDRRSEFNNIELAIIRDILQKDDLKKYPVKTVTTYYGDKYKYYKDSFEKDGGMDKYNAEFVFREVGKEGIVVFLYIYTTRAEDNDAKEEIMMTMRLMEAK